MNDDELLRAIARAARSRKARDPLDPRWDALSAGELDEAQERALRESTDPTLRERAQNAFAPLDAAFRARATRAAVAAVRAAPSAVDADRERDHDNDKEGQDDDDERSDGAPGAGPDNVVPLRRRGLRTPLVFGLAATALLAVGVVFTIRLTDPADGAALPAYGYQLRGTATVRGSEAGAPRVRTDESFEILLSPATSAGGPARVRLYRDDGERLLEVPLQSSDVAGSGAIRVRASATGLPVGANTLVAVISRGDWPADRTQLDTGPWRALRIPLTVATPD